MPPIEMTDLPRMVIQVEDAILHTLDPFRDKEYPGPAFVFGTAAALATVMVSCLPPGVDPSDPGAQAHMEKTLDFVRQHFVSRGGSSPPPSEPDESQQ